MGLDNIKKKSNALGKKSKSSILKVNKYENPQSALNLIAHICTMSKSINIDRFFESTFDVINKMDSEFENSINSTHYFMLFSNLYDELIEFTQELKLEIEQGNTYSFKIAICGGYSSGKSTLLNTFTQIGDKLPTGIEPVSMINTYLNCSKKFTQLSILGENLKNELVYLDEEVLDCIQHASKSKVHIASVLNKLTLNIPINNDIFDNITFIDTPGYNNSNNFNIENSKRDSDTALDGIKYTDAVFWCIDIEAGTISEKDFQMLEKIDNKPFIILFTKSSKKPDSEIDKIIHSAWNDCKNRLNTSILPFDIIATECDENTVKIHSNKHNDINKIIQNLKQKSISPNTDALLQHLRNFIYDKLNEPIKIAKANIDFTENERKEFSKIKSSNAEIISTNKNEIRKIKREIEDYFYQEDKDYITGIVDYLENTLKAFTDLVSEDLRNDYKKRVKGLEEDEKMYKFLKKYQTQFIAAIADSFSKSTKYVNNHYKQLQQLKHKNNSIDIFSAIASDNIEAFLSCFSTGVDLSICNTQGYSPITFAAKYGNNEMIKFFITNNVDLSLKDKNNHNALEIATIYHYQDICQLLIDADKNLLLESEDLTKLADKNNFKNWINNLQNN